MDRAGKMKKQITLLGALHIAASILYILISTAIIAVLFGIGLFDGRATELMIQGMICLVVAAFLLIIAVSGIFSGIGLMHNWGWAKIMVLILGCVNLVLLPFGTVLGIYSIYEYMHDYTPQQRESRIASPDDLSDEETGSLIVNDGEMKNIAIFRPGVAAVHQVAGE